MFFALFVGRVRSWHNLVYKASSYTLTDGKSGEVLLSTKPFWSVSCSRSILLNNWTRQGLKNIKKNNWKQTPQKAPVWLSDIIQVPKIIRRQTDLKEVIYTLLAERLPWRFQIKVPPHTLYKVGARARLHGLCPMNCTEQFNVCPVVLIVLKLVPIYLHYLGECCNAALLLSSRNVLWITKLRSTFHQHEDVQIVTEFSFWGEFIL